MCHKLIRAGFACSLGMGTFCGITATRIEGYLAAKGFSRTVRNHEVTYVRHGNRCPALWVAVYTTISDGCVSGRGCGQDAIRVCVFYDDGRGRSFGVGKFPHIKRTGSEEAILDRLQERILAAYDRAAEWLEQHPLAVAQAS